MSFNQPPSLTQAINALARRVGILERRPFPRPRFMDLADADLSKVMDGQVPTFHKPSGRYVPGNAGGGLTYGVPLSKFTYVGDDGDYEMWLSDAGVELGLADSTRATLTGRVQWDGSLGAYLDGWAYIVDVVNDVLYTATYDNWALVPADTISTIAVWWSIHPWSVEDLSPGNYDFRVLAFQKVTGGPTGGFLSVDVAQKVSSIELASGVPL